MQDLPGLGHVRDVRRRPYHGMHQTAFGIHASMRFHAEIPLVPLLGLVHLRVASLGLILDRWRGGKNRGIGDRPFPHHQARGRPLAVDRLEYLLRQFMLLQQMPELQQRCRIRCRFPRQVDPDKTTQCPAVYTIRICGDKISGSLEMPQATNPQRHHSCRRCTTKALNNRET